jgi:PIN domain-containing protein
MFVDTNVLVYASVQGAPNRDSARAALAHHASSGETLRISRQILREFVPVTTRPQTWARAQTRADAAISAAALAQERGDGLSDAATSGKQLTCRQIPRIETTAIYASAIGDEERNLARRAWSSLELAIPDAQLPSVARAATQ